MIQLDDKALGGILSEAILRTLDPATREALIKDAMANLLTPVDAGGGYYGDRKKQSPIQRAFYEALHVVARTEIERMLSGKLPDGTPDPDPQAAALAASVRGLVTDAVERVTTGDGREQLVRGMAGAITDWLQRDR